MGKRNDSDIAAAALGRAVLAEEAAAELAKSLATAAERIGRLENLVRFLEENLKHLAQPRTLLTEKEAAEMLRVSLRTMRNWRNEKPVRIAFIPYEGGDIRYRVEAVESYLKSRERGGAKGAVLRAA